MAWSGPVAGAPQFQHPPHGNPQPAYGQPAAHQYGQPPPHAGYGQFPPGHSRPLAHGPPQRASDNRPPKKKGNPVITRYPPPPGYRGPAQSQGPFGTKQFPGRYQAPHSRYPQVSHPPPSYITHGYTAAPVAHGFQGQGYCASQPSNYVPSAYPSAQKQQWPPQQSYQPHQGYSQPLIPPAMQGYAPPRGSYQGHIPHHAPGEPHQQAYDRAGGWPSQYGQAQMPIQDHHVSPHSVATSSMDPNATPTPATVRMATSRAASIPSQSNSALRPKNAGEKPQIFSGWDDWDFDFDGAIWPKSHEPVDPALSLGVIIWHPAKQVTRALPSTFADAEAQALDAAPEGLGNGESVSMYFTAENSHEAYLDVRQTDDWCTIQDDPVFVVFTDEEMQNNFVSIEDCIAQRDRPEISSADKNRNEDHEMHDASCDIMDNLEQALTSTNGDSKSKHVKQEDMVAEHALTSTNGDSKSKHIKQEDIVAPTLTQEDILAQLGVTGAPKPPSSSHPIPVGQPPVSLSGKSSTVPHTKSPESQRAHPRANSSNKLQNPTYGAALQRPYGSTSSGSTSRPPPPPPPPEQPLYDPWNAPQRSDHRYSGRTGSPALSEGSNRTMAGSDFDSEKPSDSNEHALSAVPTLQRSDSSYNRKRSYEDADKDEEQLRQHDDHSKRKRRSQVDAAYSRR